jgi:hypothetical protein
MTRLLVKFILVASSVAFFNLLWANHHYLGGTTASSERSQHQRPSRLTTSTRSQPNSDELDPYEHLLTIAIDSRVSCPDNCRFVHLLFPEWVKFRIISFEDETDLAPKDDTTTHLLIVGRTNIVKLSQFAERRRQNEHGMTVGLFHMADERVFFPEIAPYSKFDYVLRNYFWAPDHKAAQSFNLRALGNHTCGETSPLPELGLPGVGGPRYGVHWVHLNPHSQPIELRRSVRSVWPISKRPIDCSFRGRGDVKRSIGERKQMQEAVKDMTCAVEFTKSFAGGLGQFEYMNGDLTNTKIGLCPRGSAIETHRLSEVMAMGGVPALKDELYLHATFRSVPAIIGAEWNDTAILISHHLSNIDQLEAMARNLAKFQKELQRCMVRDMDAILRGAFLDSSKN